MSEEIQVQHEPLDPDKLYAELDAKLGELHGLDRGRIRAAYEILMKAGGKVDPGTRVIITPSTTEVMLACVKEGLAEAFLKAGIVFTNPTCALCTAEHYGALPAGDVGIATNNRNFIGKVGKGSHTYLMSPMSAMASAVKGVITDPREFL